MLYEYEGKAPVISDKAYISDEATIIGDVTIAEDCYVGPGAVIRGDYGPIRIGAGSAVEDGVIIHIQLGSEANIGEKVTMGHGCIVHAKEVGDMVTVGMGAILSMNCVVGKNTIIAEGSVVKRADTIPEGVMAAGTPAKVVRPLSEEDNARWTRGKQAYIDLARKCVAGAVKRIG